MKQREIAKYFERSQLAGIIYELINYVVMLLCGYWLSKLLETVMKGKELVLYEGPAYTVLILLSAVFLKVGLTVWRSRTRLCDTQNFREFLYQGLLNGGVEILDRGEMNVRMNGDVKTIADYFEHTIPKAVSGCIVMCCSTILVCVIDWRIGILFLY